MIYLIKSPSFKHKFILKIGYTMDDRGEKRFESYVGCNPDIEVLYTIPEGTPEDEANLHKYFKHLRYCRFEWYIDSLDIINFFKTHTTKESLKEIDIFSSSLTYGDLLSKKTKILRPFVTAVKKITGRLDESIYDLCFHASEKVGLEWVCNYYPDLAAPILQEYENMKTLLENDKLKKFIKHLQTPSMGHISDRLKLLCETDEFTDDEKKLIAQQVSEKFDLYYNLVGPEVCKGYGYNITLIKNKVRDLSIPALNVKNEFLLTFQVGKRYTNKDAKNAIKEIYERLGILTKTGKTTDLNEFFNIKPIKFFDSSSGKWIHGIEILGTR